MTAETDLPPSHPDGTAAGISIRAREAADWRDIYALTQLPRVRWGTLRLPFANPEQTRKWMDNQQDGETAIVALIDGRIVGTASVTRYPGRRRHAGGIGMCVHDEFHGRGIGTALLGALIDTADNWLDLKRLELTVFVDNERAIRLYKRFGFAIEGTRRAEGFRDGRYVDAYGMARLHGV
jgi:putative acetyltransferase